MIDDLITKGVSEPYRMFTSRAEYRLTLRADNADQRLTPIGIQIGLVRDERKKYHFEKVKKLQKIINTLKSFTLTPNEASKHSIKIAQDGVRRKLTDVMSQRNLNMAKIRQIYPSIPNFGNAFDKQVEIDIHYKGYLKRQSNDIQAFRRDETLKIPYDLDYNNLSGLSNEIKSKLIKIRPSTLGQAIRIDGVTPAAIIILLGYIKRHRGSAAS